MNFVDKNTNVEWSNTTMSRNDENLNVLITTHESDRVTLGTGKLLQYKHSGYSIRKDDHIHPSQFSPNASGSDMKRKRVLSPANDAKYRILYQGKYYSY